MAQKTRRAKTHLEPEDLLAMRLANAEFQCASELFTRTKLERDLCVRNAEAVLLKAQIELLKAERTMSDTMRQAAKTFEAVRDDQKKLAAEIAERYSCDWRTTAFDPATGQLMPLSGEFNGDSPASGS